MSEEDEKQRRKEDLESKELIKKHLAHDPDAFKKLLDLNDRRQRRRAAKILRTKDENGLDDVAQEVWIQVWQRLEGYDPMKGTFWAWLAAITHSVCLDQVRHAHRRRNVNRSIEDPDRTPDLKGVPVPDTAAKRELVEIAMRGVADLPAEQQQALKAHLQGKTDKEIAEETGESPRNITYRIASAARKLGAFMKKMAS